MHICTKLHAMDHDNLLHIHISNIFLVILQAPSVCMQCMAHSFMSCMYSWVHVCTVYASMVFLLSDCKSLHEYNISVYIFASLQWCVSYTLSL